jgi:hypothetical protein
MQHNECSGTRRPFLPFGAATGIGSLPMRSARSAVEFVAERSPVVPFWPQLPRRCPQERAILQGLGSLADLVEPRQSGYGYRARPGCLDELLWRLEAGPVEMDARCAAGLVEFEDALKAGAFRSARALKGQIEGPITLASYIFDGDRPFVIEDDYLQAVTAHIGRLAQAQIRMLRQFELPVLFFIDEPGLCLAQRATSRSSQARALASCLRVVQNSGALSGLHCCADQPIERMCRANPDILSFDAHRGLERFFESPTARSFLRRGGSVAYGLVPTWNRLNELSADQLVARWLRGATQAGDIKGLARRAMITSTCGLGLVSESAAARSFELSQQIAALLERIACG